LKNFFACRAYFGPAGQQLVTQRNAATDAILPPVDYPVGVIAANRSIYPIASAWLLPRPNDGRVSVKNTRLDGMTDHIAVSASHPWMVRNRLAIEQVVAFLRNCRFNAGGAGGP
jgi:hypothetical protein